MREGFADTSTTCCVAAGPGLRSRRLRGCADPHGDRAERDAGRGGRAQRPDFLTDLHGRLAEQMGESHRNGPRQNGRRQPPPGHRRHVGRRHRGGRRGLGRPHPDRGQPATVRTPEPPPGNSRPTRAAGSASRPARMCPTAPCTPSTSAR